MSGELWSEFDCFLNGNFLSFLILYPYGDVRLPKEITDIVSRLSIQFNDVIFPLLEGFGQT